MGELDSKNIAKSIFHQYGCSKYFMALDDMVDTYESYKIDQQQETLWKREYYEIKMSELLQSDTESFGFIFGDMVRMVESEQNLNWLNEVFSILERRYESLDSFSQLVICEKQHQVLATLKNIDKLKSREYPRILKRLHHLQGQLEENSFTCSESVSADQLFQKLVLATPVLRSRIQENIKQIFSEDKKMTDCLESPNTSPDIVQKF